MILFVLPVDWEHLAILLSVIGARGLMLWMHVDVTTCLGLAEKAPEKLEVVKRPTTLKATRRPETERSEGNVSDSDLAGHFSFDIC